MADSDTTIAELLRMHKEHLTRNEALAADALLGNYPLAGLQPISRFAQEAGVSAQSILRLISKLGFSGYGEFQDRLKMELTTILQSPRGRLRAHERGETKAPDFVGAFADRLARNIRDTLTKIHKSELDRSVRLLADDRRDVIVLGGRLTGSVAAHLATHLQVVRHGVTLLGGQSASWPDRMLDISRQTVVVAFDIRRYQNDVIRFCAGAAKRHAKVILVTDSLQATATAHAHLVLVAETQSLSAWDSFAGLLALSELLIARVSDTYGVALGERIEELDRVRDRFFSPG